MAQGCILQIDDDPNEQFLLERSAAAAQVHLPLVSVSSGYEGIEYIQGVNGYADRSRYPKPCLVLLDLKMPVLDGFEVLRWIREQQELQTLPVIMLSSSNMAGDIEKGLKLGANAFVRKPSAYETLVKLMKAIDAFWLNFHEFDALSGCSSQRFEFA